MYSGATEDEDKTITDRWQRYGSETDWPELNKRKLSPQVYSAACHSTQHTQVAISPLVTCPRRSSWLNIRMGSLATGHHEKEEAVPFLSLIKLAASEKEHVPTIDLREYLGKMGGYLMKSESVSS